MVKKRKLILAFICFIIGSAIEFISGSLIDSEKFIFPFCLFLFGMILLVCSALIVYRNDL